MNSVKSQDTDNFKVLVVGAGNQGTLRMLQSLRERYGDRLEVVKKADCDEIDGMGISFIVMDELYPVPETVASKPFLLRNKRYWQKGRWG